MEQYVTNNAPCGDLTSSSCVLYTGKKIDALPEKTTYYKLNEVIESLNDTIKTIKNSTDVSTLDTSSVGIETGKASLLQLLQVILTNLGLIKNQLTILNQSSLESILATPVPIDLSGLTDPCDGPSLTPLLTLLTTLVNEVTLLKNN